MYEQGRFSGPISMIVLSVFLISAISIAAVFSSGSQFGSPSTTNFHGAEAPASLLARRAAALKTTPTISDEELHQIHEAIMKRAKAGELEAAAFVFDLAARQRMPVKGSSTTQPARRIEN